MAPNELQDLLTQALADLQFRAREHFAVFGNDGLGNLEPSRFGDRQNEDSTLEAVWFQSRRDHDVRVDDQPERDHPRLDLAARAVLMTWSICREVSLSVPLRFDSWPITRSTSGSGAARRT